MSEFRPIETIPPDRRDGREMRIKTSSGREYLARFFARSGEWCEVVTGGQLLGVVAWADVDAAPYAASATGGTAPIAKPQLPPSVAAPIAGDPGP